MAVHLWSVRSEWLGNLGCQASPEWCLISALQEVAKRCVECGVLARSLLLTLLDAMQDIKSSAWVCRNAVLLPIGCHAITIWLHCLPHCLRVLPISVC